jgi:RNA polymerase sigma factor (sigma-70 family)
MYGVSSEEAEDIMHSTFEALWSRWEKIREPSHYFRKALRLRALLYKRNQQKEWLATNSLYESAQGAALVTEAFQEQQEVFDKIIDNLGKLLTDKERDVLVRHFLNRQSYKQIGSDLGISPAAARQATMRGKRKLRQAFPKR